MPPLLQLFDMSSRWFNCTEPSLTTSLEGRHSRTSFVISVSWNQPQAEANGSRVLSIFPLLILSCMIFSLTSRNFCQCKAFFMPPSLVDGEIQTIDKLIEFFPQLNLDHLKQMQTAPGNDCPGVLSIFSSSDFILIFSLTSRNFCQCVDGEIQTIDKLIGIFSSIESGSPQTAL